MSKSCWRRYCAVATVLLTSGCAGLPLEQGRSKVRSLTQSRTAIVIPIENAAAADAVQAQITAWLAEPTTEQLQVRDVAELKLFFGELARPEDVLNLAREQIRQHEERIEVYESMQARFSDREDVAARMVPLRLGLELEYTALRFWRELLAERSSS